MFVQNALVPLRINGGFPDVQVTHVIGTNTPPNYDRRLILNFVSATIGMVLFLFGPENTISVFSKTLFCQTTVHVYVSPSQTSFDPEKSAAFLDVVDIWRPLCVVKSYLAFAEAATNFSEKSFLKDSQAHVVLFIIETCQFLMHCCLRDRRSWASNIDFIAKTFNLLINGMDCKSINSLQSCIEKGS